MEHVRARQALLALVLLLQKVVAAVPLEGDLAASGLAEALLCAAVGLKSGHEKRGKGLYGHGSIDRFTENAKEKGKCQRWTPTLRTGAHFALAP